jgi:SPP1 family predicted phage head-tail adaptor
MVLKGAMRDYITVQVATRTSDSQGGFTTGWTDTYYEWSQVKTLSESRALENGGIKYRIAVEITLRSRTDYTLGPEHRIKYGTTYYTINSVVPSLKGDILTVLAYA